MEGREIVQVTITTAGVWPSTGVKRGWSCTDEHWRPQRVRRRRTQGMTGREEAGWSACSSWLDCWSFGLGPLGGVVWKTASKGGVLSLVRGC